MSSGSSCQSQSQSPCNGRQGLLPSASWSLMYWLLSSHVASLLFFNGPHSHVLSLCTCCSHRPDTLLRDKALVLAAVFPSNFAQMASFFPVSFSLTALSNCTSILNALLPFLSQFSQPPLLHLVGPPPSPSGVDAFRAGVCVFRA